MKKLVLILIILLSIFNCKKSTKSTEEPIPQILGARYSDRYLDIYSKPGSTKKNERIGFIYALEEVTGLEIVKEKDKEFLKLRTSTKKEGYARLDKFYEAVYVTTEEGITAYKKPTITAPIQGKIGRASICYIKEIQEDWGKANCINAKFDFGNKPVSYYDIWIQLTEAALSKDIALAQTAMTIKQATNSIAELSKSNNLDSLKAKIKKDLDLAIEKQDLFSAYAQELLDKVESYSQETNVEEVPNHSETTNSEEKSKEPTPIQTDQTEENFNLED